MRLIVSACLLGLCTRYDGQSGEDSRVTALAQRHILIPVCPEQLGGLPTPRPASEIRDGRVISSLGADVTRAFARGAQEGLRLFRLLGCGAAVLKSRSPSCGKGWVYDGSFSGRLTRGNGVFAALLMAEGLAVYGEEETELIE